MLTRSSKTFIIEEVKEESSKKIKRRRKGYRQIEITTKPKRAFVYKIPKSIYEKYMKEISRTPNENSRARVKRAKCHQKTYEKFNTSGETPNCLSNLLVAARQAFESRDFKTLIEILDKSLKIRDMILKQQVLAYMEGEND